ncbi:MAG: ABC transporter ATP-binding protein [Desulfurococcaceae archaeon TW002]
MGKEAVEVAGLVKKYFTKKRKGLLKSEKLVIEALKGISFTVNYGEVVGFLGPNGAGKTTTIKILSTLLLPDSGKVRIGGFDVVKEANKVRKLIGVMLSVEKGFYGKLTGRENLIYFGSLYGLSGSELRRRVDEMIEIVGLKELEAEDKLYEEYSTGMKARLSLARALLKDPPILLLDEPTLGLDPMSARKVRDLVKSLAFREGKAVIYTTHNMFEAELVCDRILLINKGLIVASGTPEELKKKVSDIKTVVLQVRKSAGDLNTFLSKLTNIAVGNIATEELDVNYIEIKFNVRAAEDLLDTIVKLLTTEGLSMSSFKVVEPTLEEVFIYFAEGRAS